MPTKKAEAETKALSCGGNGPCCHIGYSHRHCEHCDVVIDTRPATWWYQPYQTYPTLTQPAPWYTTTGVHYYGNNFGNVENALSATLALGAADEA